MDKHASVHEGVEVGKRLEQGSEAVARTTDAPEPAATARQEGASISRIGRKPATGNGSPDWLGRGLRQLYQGTVSEPIPDKFRALLDRLDQQEEEAREEADRPEAPAKTGGQP